MPIGTFSMSTVIVSVSFALQASSRKYVDVEPEQVVITVIDSVVLAGQSPLRLSGSIALKSLTSTPQPRSRFIPAERAMYLDFCMVIVSVIELVQLVTRNHRHVSKPVVSLSGVDPLQCP